MRRFTRRAAIGALIATPFVYLAGREIVFLSAEQEGEKSCLPATGTVAAPADVADLPGLIRGGVIDDASCLNATPIFGRLPVKTIADIQGAIAYARANKLTLTAAGARHSMGGQSFTRDGLVLDMKRFNRIELNEQAKTVRVEAGATWHDIQNRIHPRFAIKAMQSTDIFTVGGSISVNAHGMDHQIGALMRTVRSMRVVMADGSIRDITPASDPDLFRHIVGGYGLFGVIAEAEIEVTDNVIYRTGRRTIDYRDFPRVFDQEILPDREIGLFYGHLNPAPGSGFFRELLLYAYRAAGPSRADLPPLKDVGLVGLRRFIINLAKRGALFSQAKWFAETSIDPLLESCTVPNPAGGEGCLVSRNEPMHDSVPYLMNARTDEADILHEYFVPRRNFVPFIDAVRAVLESVAVSVVNASVRVVHREDNVLTYAPEDAFSLVLYINQFASAAGNARMAQVTRDLIQATLANGGRFFLPYQLHYEASDLVRSYPEVRAFFAAKRRYDPDGLLTNTLYAKYAAIA
jgi:FAD/FMN-containing dehydrogenase